MLDTLLRVVFFCQKAYALAYVRVMTDRDDDAIRRDAALRRWAVVRFVLGALQMVGAMMTLALLAQTGTSGLRVGTAVVTGVVVMVSVFLFQSRRLGR